MRRAAGYAPTVSTVFQLDRGFQVFLSGYPEARRVLDYPALKLRPFHPGALVRYAGRFHRISDPLRRPQDLSPPLTSPIGSLGDKLKILGLRQDALNQRLCGRVGGGERTTMEALQAYGFSPAMQERFFRPFLSGVFRPVLVISLSSCSSSCGRRFRAARLPCRRWGWA